MLWIISTILLLFWLLGLITAHTLGGFIHMLLIMALAVLAIQLMEYRRAI
jgi:hypothetical protein